MLCFKFETVSSLIPTQCSVKAESVLKENNCDSAQLGFAINVV